MLRVIEEHNYYKWVDGWNEQQLAAQYYTAYTAFTNATLFYEDILTSLNTTQRLFSHSDFLSRKRQYLS